MALIVPILRLMMLFLNIYETSKVLKPPRPSPRNSGQPTVRALSQRKRNMKGCLAVWIVWCCFMIYERMAEKVVSILIPFYNEFKSLVLLFLIFTRARGAEPIYLHIIRPFLKPYTSTLDALSDAVRMFGDIIFLFLTYPFHLVLSWWHSTFGHRDSAVEGEADEGLYTEVQQVLHSVSHQMPIQASGRRRSSGPIPDGQMPIQSGGRRRSSGPIRADDSLPAEQNASPHPHVATDRSPTRVPVHEIWHPPRSAFHDEGDDYIDPAPLDPPPEFEEARRAREQMEEWRQYPPFPSAYPPTPLPPSSNTHHPEQDFGQSLPSPHELPNSGSAGDSSDEHNVLGIQNGSSNETAAFQDDTMDEDDEEDDFNVTLRTPGEMVVPDTITAPRTRSRTKASHPPSAATLVALPSLLSRISSDTSSVSSDSSSSSLVTRKRSRELVVAAPAAKAVALRGRSASKRTSAHTTDVPLERIEDESSEVSSSSTSENEEDTDANSGVSEPKSPVTKRRRVASPPSRVQPRRTTRTTSQEPPAAPFLHDDSGNRKPRRPRSRLRPLVAGRRLVWLMGLLVWRPTKGWLLILTDSL
ncbi:hypothetical protein B0H13DRAFT_2277634 [Mycena leptocephala]|nr:hypothetical protein B0H13DRAFT_2277634 [Mycena leptocephala]